MNPMFNSSAAQSMDSSAGIMTADGAMNKTVILLVITVVAALFTYNAYNMGQLTSMTPIYGSAIVGFLMALFISFKPNTAKVMAPVFAVVEGLFVGGMSALMSFMYPGIVVPAIGLTFGVLLIMLTIYRFNIIPVTNKLRTGVMAATGAIMLLYAVSFALSMLGGIQVSFIHEGGVIGIGFSLFVVGLAAFNLLLDFDFIDKGVKNEYPKNMEWYAAFGLLVTLVWLYIEILRLLSKLRD